MPRSKSLSGKTLALTLANVDQMADCTNVRITHGDADQKTITFADAAAGGLYQGTLAGTGIQSMQSSSFWRYVWANTGKEIAFKYAPSGNIVAAVDNPVFSGTVRIGKKPDVGGDAQIDGADWTFDFEWKIVGDVAMVTA